MCSYCCYSQMVMMCMNMVAAVAVDDVVSAVMMMTP